MRTLNEPAEYRPVRDRDLIQYTVEDNGCWNPERSKGRNGYITVKRPNVTEVAGVPSGRILLHRYSYLIHKGEIPEGSVVMHTCDNPRCFNPEHLDTGTQAENQEDAARKDRFNPRKGEDHGNSKLTEEDVKEIYFSIDTHKNLAERFGVSNATVSYIRNRKIWTHLDLPERPDPNKILTQEDKERIFTSKKTAEELNEEYRIGVRWIRMIKNGNF